MGLFSTEKIFGATIRESATDGSDFTNPDADYRRLFLGEDGLLHLKDSAGAVTDIGGSSGIPATIFDAKGDIIAATAADTASRLAAGTNGLALVAASGETTGLKWGVPNAHGFLMYHNTTQTVNGVAIPMNSELDDTDLYHFTSAAALTGTVTKTATSPNIVGVGTAFTTELTVNQVISIPGTATEIGVVKVITDNTNLELWQTMANTAAGQTATRKSEYAAIPTGLAGVYTMEFGSNVASLAAGEFLRIQKTGAAISLNEGGTSAVGSGYVSGVAIRRCVAGDYLSVLFTGNRTLGHASAFEAQTHFSAYLIGA